MVSDQLRSVLDENVSSTLTAKAEEANQYVALFERHVIFVIHLPPGLSNRQRWYPLSFSRLWRHSFVDDLRPVSDGSTKDVLSDDLPVRGWTTLANKKLQKSLIALSTSDMISESCYDLIQTGRLPVRVVLITNYRTVLSRLAASVPSSKSDQIANTYRRRLVMIRSLLKHEQFINIAEKATTVILENTARDANVHVDIALSIAAVGSVRFQNCFFTYITIKILFLTFFLTKTIFPHITFETKSCVIHCGSYCPCFCNVLSLY